MRLPYVQKASRAMPAGRLSAATLGKAARRVYLPVLDFAAGAGRLSIPNLISLARILLVPVVVWAIASNQVLFAFLLFPAAGVSDAVDGFLAKRFGIASELGALLDPLADKVLIVSIYVALGIMDALPRWLVILVVSRDLLIVGGVMFSWIVNKPVNVKPHIVSKINTAAQPLLAGLALASPR